jgi:diguanylate cyclase (GGDEF)-like protein/PAS domain S-box-containing protein
MHEILFELDAAGRITFLNPAWQQLTGFPIDEAMGRPFTGFLMDEDVIDDFDPEFLGELREKNRELRMRTADGRGLWASLDADAQQDDSGRFSGIIGTLSDITQSVELNTLLAKYRDDLYVLSVTDPLTNLYNRRHFDNQLDIILSERLPLGQSVCLLIIDLDGFKFINDTYGHPAGDHALRTIAQLLQTAARADDYLARLAGDEFAMVLIDTNLKTAALIAAKLHASINETRIELPIGHIQLRCSIGVAEAPLHGHNLQELVSAADVALYQSKRQGRNRVEVLSADTSETVMTIFNQGFQLRNALQDGGLIPAFQPICDMRTGQPVAYEALARMRINNNTIRAAEFIGVAEELGLTREIDLHIIEQSLRLAPVGYDLFLNLDPSSFNNRDFVEQLTRLLAPACRSGRAITIEITERENVIVTDALLADIGELRKLGCKLALDDFGSGYSTYQFLNLFRPEYLKIEGAFVRGMLDNEADRKIVEHIHDLAVAFGISTIAESVENEDTCLALLGMGIHNAQGFHLGSPELRHL